MAGFHARKESGREHRLGGRVSSDSRVIGGSLVEGAGGEDPRHDLSGGIPLTRRPGCQDAPAGATPAT